MSMFGAGEVAIITRFGEELYEWADVDLVESFMRMSPTERLLLIDQYSVNGDNMLTFLYLKTIVFKLNNGHVDDVTTEMESLGIDWPSKGKNVVRLFS